MRRWHGRVATGWIKLAISEMNSEKQFQRKSSSRKQQLSSLRLREQKEAYVWLGVDDLNIGIVRDVVARFLS